MDESKTQRREKVLAALNQARSMELYAISQYMNQHYALDAMDYGELAKNMKLIAIDEMRHAEDFAERIKELEGEPTAEPGEKVQKGQPVEEIFSFDARLEDDTMDTYNQLLMVCREMGDNVSARLFETVIGEELLHHNHFESVAGHIASLGQAYLSRLAGTPASTGPPSKGFVLTSGGEA